jgi:hypothetical protein
MYSTILGESSFIFKPLRKDKYSIKLNRDNCAQANLSVPVTVQQGAAGV